MARHPRWVRRFLPPEDLAALQEAIAAAERQTSGEIRVHLERRLPRGRPSPPAGGRAPAAGGRAAAAAGADPALERAGEVFVRLGMTRTAGRNGVLVYLAVEDHRLAIVGDQAVHAVVGDGYWAGLRDAMAALLRAGRPRDALLTAVGQVGRTLRERFPRRPDDRDELADQVSLG